jgi:hypothetical protein
MERMVFVTEGWGRGMRGTVRGSNFIIIISPVFSPPSIQHQMEILDHLERS